MYKKSRVKSAPIGPCTECFKKDAKIVFLYKRIQAYKNYISRIKRGRKTLMSYLKFVKNNGK